VGPNWVRFPIGSTPGDLTLRLVRDDVPITGQVIDLEGKPLAGVTLTVVRISATDGEDLGPWLKAAAAGEIPDSAVERRYFKRTTIVPAPTATTDAGGRFRLTGI